MQKAQLYEQGSRSEGEVQPSLLEKSPPVSLQRHGMALAFWPRALPIVYTSQVEGPWRTALWYGHFPREGSELKLDSFFEDSETLCFVSTAKYILKPSRIIPDYSALSSWVCFFCLPIWLMEDQVLPHKEPPALGFLGSLCNTTKLDSVNIHQKVIKTWNMYWHERCPTDKFEEKCRLRLHWTGCSSWLTLHGPRCSPGSRPWVG